VRRAHVRTHAKNHVAAVARSLRVVPVALSVLLVIGFATEAVPSPSRMIITGVPPITDRRSSGEYLLDRPAGCGPIAAYMLLAFYARAHGYSRLVEPGIAGGLAQLYRDMWTTQIPFSPLAATLPLLFSEGLEAYIEDRHPGELDLGIADGTPDAVFERSARLIRDGIPHVLLFDWLDQYGILPIPNHYAVVVGYRADGGRKELIVNAGWGPGSEFQIVDMADPGVAPASILWIQRLPDPGDPHPIRVELPTSSLAWIEDERGAAQLEPTLTSYAPDCHPMTWRPSDKTTPLLPDGVDSGLRMCAWYDASEDP